MIGRWETCMHFGFCGVTGQQWGEAKGMKPKFCLSKEHWGLEGGQEGTNPLPDRRKQKVTQGRAGGYWGDGTSPFKARDRQRYYHRTGGGGSHERNTETRLQWWEVWGNLKERSYCPGEWATGSTAMVSSAALLDWQLTWDWATWQRCLSFWSWSKPCGVGVAGDCTC